MDNNLKRDIKQKSLFVAKYAEYIISLSRTIIHEER
jgi:hypothetical protein